MVMQLNPAKSIESKVIIEFLDTCDKDVSDWLFELLAGYMSSEKVEITDSDYRAKLMRNFNAVVRLVNGIQQTKA